MGAALVNPSTELRLHEYVRSWMGEPFEFGVNDCPLFAAGALDIMAGTTYRIDLTGRWYDQKSAWKYLKTHGDIYAHLARAGCSPVECSHIQTGDFICMEQKLAHEKKWHSVGVFLGARAGIVTDEAGVILVPMGEVPNVTRVLRWQ